MYKIVPWSKDLDLTAFYQKADLKGYKNNSSEQMLIHSFNKEKKKQTWILYYNEKPVGSVASHSLDLFGDNSYRICARTCVFTDELPLNSLRTIKGITQHQNVTAQFLIPTCIDWAGKENDLYISSNESKEASQRLVHTIFCPALEKTGVLEHSGDHFYRGHVQSFWKLNVKKFFEDLDYYGRWNYYV